MADPVRITLGFAVAMAVVLTVVGLVGYRQLRTGLADDLDRELQQRAQDLTPAVNRPGAALADPAGTGFIERGESFAEVVATDGRVLQSTPTLAGRPLLSSAEITQAGARTIFVDRPTAPGLDEPARLLATRVTRAGSPAFLVVGLTRGNGEETLARVRLQLVVGLPLLLLLTSLLGYLLTGAALRPVEVMRRRASTMSGAELGPRLPCRPATTSWRAWGRPSTTSWTGSGSRWPASGPSWPPPATSCVRPWRCCGPSWSSRSADRGRCRT